MKRFFHFWRLPKFIFSVCCAVIVFLPSFGPVEWLSTRIFFAQLIAFPVLLGLFLVFALCVSALINCCRLSDTGSRSTPHKLLDIATYVLAGASALCLVVAPYLPLSLTHTYSSETVFGTGTSSSMRLIEWNVLDQLTTPELRNLLNQNPDVIVLAEASVRLDGQPQLKPQLQELGEEENWEIFTSSQDTSSGDVAPVTILIKKDFGEYAPISPPAITFGAVFLEPVNDSSLPKILGVHTAPPVPSLMENWRTDLSVLSAFAENHESDDLVIAGDFNATLRHGQMADFPLYDSLFSQQVMGNQGTWPQNFLRYLSSPIDHIMVGGTLTATSALVGEAQISDHRPLIVDINF